MSVTELKERHLAATDTANNLKERLSQRRLSLIDTDGKQKIDLFPLIFLNIFYLGVELCLWVTTGFRSS